MKTKDDALVAKTQGISDESQQTLYCPHTHTSLIVKVIAIPKSCIGVGAVRLYTIDSRVLGQS